MLRLREKLKYMALGGLIVLAGFVFGNMNKNTQAQSGAESINELTVRNMIVLEDIKVINDGNVPQVVINWDDNGGNVSAHSPRGQAALGVGEHGGLIQVGNAEGKIGAQVTMNENGGTVVVRSISGSGAAALAIYEGNGVVYTRDRLGNISALD